MLTRRDERAVARKTLVGPIWPDRAWAAPGQTKTSFFVMPKIHRNSNYIYNASQQSQWQTHKCARSRLCCRQTFLKFLTWMEIKPKHHKISGRTSYRNTFSFKTMVQMESLYSKGFPLWLSAQQISRTPNRGKPQTRQQFRIRNIYITRPVWSRKTRWIQQWNYFFFKADRKWRWYVAEN